MHVSQATCICEQDHDIPILPNIPITDVEKQIASHIVERIPDGSTVQLGFGAIANAVGFFLDGKKDLGVHTEMITDSMMDLAKKGVVNGSRKDLLPGQDDLRVRRGVQGALRVHAPQPDARIDADPHGQRHRQHRHERQLHIDQQRPHGRPDRAGLLRVDRLQHVQLHRRPARLRARRPPLEGRKVLHGAQLDVHDQGGARHPHRGDPARRAPW